MVLLAHGCGDHATPGVVTNGPNGRRRLRLSWLMSPSWEPVDRCAGQQHRGQPETSRTTCGFRPASSRPGTGTMPHSLASRWSDTLTYPRPVTASGLGGVMTIIPDCPNCPATGADPGITGQVRWVNGSGTPSTPPSGSAWPADTSGPHSGHRPRGHSSSQSAAPREDRARRPHRSVGHSMVSRRAWSAAVELSHSS